jgi:hypothetical protein
MDKIWCYGDPPTKVLRQIETITCRRHRTNAFQMQHKAQVSRSCDTSTLLPSDDIQHSSRLPKAKQQCQICHKLIDPKEKLSSFVNHAKRHCELKQFACPMCTYTSIEPMRVRHHMKRTHCAINLDPVDNWCV